MNRLKKVSLSAIIFSCLIASPTDVLPDLFPTPHIDNELAFVYSHTPVKEEEFRKKDAGLGLMNAYSIIQQKRISGPDGDKVVMTLDAYAKKVGAVIMTLEFKEKDDRLQQTRFTREIIDPSGKTALFFEIDFENFRDIFPEDVYALEVIMFLYRGLDMTPKSKFTYHWWTTESSAFRMHTKVKKPEKITVPAGTFTCYPIELYVDFAEFLDRGQYINTLINPFVPDHIMYYDVNPPHYYVHYQGPMGPPGSLESKVDLVKIVKGEQEIEKIRNRIKSPDYYTDDGKLPNIFE